MFAQVRDCLWLWQRTRGSCIGEQAGFMSASENTRGLGAVKAENLRRA